jgi:transcriptional regulator with XRE-family HTH domain
LTVREFARRLGVSPSAISKIETGKYRPSVSVLWAIVTELGMTLDELFGPAPESQTAKEPARQTRQRDRRTAADVEAPVHRNRLQRADSRKVIELESGVRWEQLTATIDPQADFLFVVYDVGGSSSANDVFIRHSGYEYGVVLTGTLEVTVVFETYVLGPGDSISFESTTPHRLKSISDEPVTGIWFVLGRHNSDPRTGDLNA